jgi:hypothetical protein
MYQVTAGSVEEFFRFDPAREDDLRALDALIRAAAPSLPRWLFPGTPPGQPGMTITMIGYGRFEYPIQSSPTPISWPILGLALQKNYISRYSGAQAGGPPFTRAYAGKLGRARVSGTGVVTFAGVGDVDVAALAGMITAIEAGLADGRLTPRAKDRP